MRDPSERVHARQGNRRCGEGPIRFRLALARRGCRADNRSSPEEGEQARRCTASTASTPTAPARSVVLVEGESDCHTGWYHGLNVIGLPGADNWNEERDATLFDGFEHIAIVIEPDQGGESLKARLGKSRIRDRAHLVSLASTKISAPAPRLSRSCRVPRAVLAAVRASVPWSEYEGQQADRARREAWEACRQLATTPDILACFVESQQARGSRRGARPANRLPRRHQSFPRPSGISR